MAFHKAQLIGSLSLWLVLALVTNAQPTAPAPAAESVAELAAALLAAPDDAQREALLAAQKSLLTRELSDQLTSQGKSLFLKSDYDGALRAYQWARVVAERISYPKGIIVALNETGIAQMGRGNVKAALELFQQAMRLAESNHEKSLFATLQLTLCAAQIRLGNLDQATNDCRQCLAFAEAEGNKAKMAGAYVNLGFIARLRGDYEASIEFSQKGLALNEANGDKRGVVRVLTSLGVSHKEMGNLTAALQYYLRTLLVAEEIGDKTGIAGTLSNASMVYRALGNYRLALEFSERSLALSEAIGDKSIISIATGAIGEIYAQRGEYAQALEYSRKSLALAEQTADQRRIAIRLSYLGDVYLRMSDYDQSLIHYQRALALAESIGTPLVAMLCQKGIAYIYLQQGKPLEALGWAERSLTIGRQLAAYEGSWETLQFAGMAHRALKRPELARQRFEEAINVIETERVQLAAGESDQAAFSQNQMGPYLQMVTLLAEQGQLAEAFHYLERSKARVLLNVLQSGKASISKAMNAAEREQERRLRDAMVALNTQLRRAEQTKPTDSTSANLAKANLEKARLAYEAFQTQLYVTHPELKAQRGKAPIIKGDELADLVDHQTALLAFALTKESAHLFAITRAANHTQPDIRVYTLPLKQDDLTAQTAAFRQQLADLDLKFRPAAKQLYDLLLKPAQAQLAGKTKLIIVPDGKLWELPFQALITPKNQYLIETAAVSYAPSLTVLREMQAQRARRGKPSGDLLAFGNPSFGQETIQRAILAYRDEKLAPLPEAEAEVKALGQLYGTRSKVYVNAAAGEARLKAEAAEAGILHIATHGVLNDAAPMYSHLALATNNEKADDEKEDGLLEAWELMQLDLKADLAVLSACETARGRIGAGEGVIGLSWAMFVAGVPSTVVSQWKVESSSTRNLMVGFHRNLKGAGKKPGAPKSEALRQSVLNLLKKPETNHPFYWAGFVLVGDWQ